jgi:hypothetical protein|tara:strand:+ start:376 stop:558 length:183 start_codon:yes stop_codon:yes gene_type:complete
MKYKIYQEVLITRTVIVEAEKDDWEELDMTADQISADEWSIENEDVQEQQYWDENNPWFE